MKLLISAAEASSDLHGAYLLRALKEEWGKYSEISTLDVFGVGGAQLQAEGLRTIVDSRELLAMGFLEIFSRLPQIIRSLNRLTQAAKEEKPDLAIVLDYPGFHFRLAKRLKKLDIPTLYYIPPKVWVWRKSRLSFLKEYFKKILLILPFEKDFYEQEGVPATYVGNPILDEIPIHLTRLEARKQLKISQEEKALVLMPGSRPSELKYHLKVMLDAALQVSQRMSPTRLNVLIPLPLTADVESIKAQVEAWQKKSLQGMSSGLSIHISQGDSHVCLIAADAGIIKSGTSTLEAGLLRCPHTVIYDGSRVSKWIFKYFIRYKGPVALVNLIYGWGSNEPYLIREILGDEISAEELARETYSLLFDVERRGVLDQKFQKLIQKTQGESEDHQSMSPSRRAAQEVIQCYLGLGKCQ